MSAYGAIVRSTTHVESDPLATTFWHIGRVAAGESVVMGKEVDDGMTYPQETLALDAFEAYFFSGDVFLAIFSSGGVGGPEGTETNLSLEEARQQRTWEECVAGYYYVKPNYPGRSSHICNGGFVVPPIHRGKGSGSALAKSYVHYAPKLGYRASVFNLVYANNAASVKLWEGLNFKKAGLIPKAGRLRRKDGNGEEYVDAWVFYRSFVNEEG
ncbi:hypothetical protein B0H16DRAFT_1494064 [Mycena metata]|uniref:N-acetyltransferase domain-containing protein n=1 Tax=Mycena metata TaxID=1033252 RepID=A0AAD7KCD3_9AGAR|nr:hypothetical protein B0H16DRAFT_1494064 [Mycena metata]